MIKSFARSQIRWHLWKVSAIICWTLTPQAQYIVSFSFDIITARKRSLRRLCFYRCLSVHMGGGGACVAGGHAWQGGVCGGGCVWWGEVRGRGGGRVLHTVNERTVRILLECILVIKMKSFINFAKWNCEFKPRQDRCMKPWNQKHVYCWTESILISD